MTDARNIVARAIELSELKNWNIIGIDPLEDNDEYKRALTVVQKTNIKLKKYLSGINLPVNIYHVFSEGISVKLGLGAGHMATYKGIAGVIDEYMHTSVVKNDTSAINVLITNVSDSGYKRKKGILSPNTPWITVHRMAHGLLKGKSTGSNSRLKRIDSLRQSYYQELYDMVYKDLFEKYGRIADYVPAEILNMTSRELFWKNIGTYGSARRGKVINSGEGIVETMTQFIVTGGVTVNPIFAKSSEIYKKYSKQIDRAERNFVDDLEDYFSAYIKSAKGKWLIV